MAVKYLVELPAPPSVTPPQSLFSIRVQLFWWVSFPPFAPRTAELGKTSLLALANPVLDSPHNSPSPHFHKPCLPTQCLLDELYSTMFFLANYTLDLNANRSSISAPKLKPGFYFA